MSWLTKISGLDFIKDVIHSFSGDTQKKAITQANTQAQNALATGKQQADTYKQQAYSLYDPMVRQGNQAWDLYQGALGLRGPEEAQRAMDTIYGNPVFSTTNDRTQQDLMAQYNAHGGGRGGNALAASERAKQDNIYRFLASIQGVGQRGDQGINNQANIRNDQGNLAYGYGGTRAGMYTNYGNAMADAANILPQNIIGLTGAVMGGGGGGGAHPMFTSNNANRYYPSYQG